MKIAGMFVWALLALSAAQAHQTGLSYLELIQKDDALVHAAYKKPLEDALAGEIAINYPSTCSRSDVKPQKIENGYIIERYTLVCGKDGLAKQRVWIEGLVASDKGVMVRYDKGAQSSNYLLRAVQPYVVFDYTPGFGEVFLDYFALGFAHILEGTDHLLFLAGLLLLLRNFRALLYAVTAFTAAHSLSLGLSVFGYVSVPAPFVEAMIALSIVMVFRQSLVASRRAGQERFWSVVFLFGLLHGLGFSSALSQIGLPPSQIPASVLAFNLGIEAGQLLFLVGVGALIKGVFALTQRDTQAQLEKGAAYAMGTVASLWLITRIASF